MAISKQQAMEQDEEACRLTEREKAVLKLAAQGLTNKAIGQELGITERTAAFHIENILKKLDVCNRTEAVMEAVRRGWLEF